MISNRTAIACLLIVASIKTAEFSKPVWEILKAAEPNSQRFTDTNQIVPIKSDIKLDEGKMTPEPLTKEEVEKGTPFKVLYASFVKSEAKPGEEAKDFSLRRLQRQYELAQKSDNIVKYDYVGRHYDAVGKRINYVAIEEQQIQNLNNYLKGKNISLEQKVDVMRKMADVLARLHMEGIKHCHVYLKKFSVMPDQTLKLRGLGFADEKTNACMAENVEVTDPQAYEVYKLNVLGAHKNRFFEDIYGLGFAFISLIDESQDKAVNNNTLLNDNDKGTGTDMSKYVNDMVDVLNKGINGLESNLEQKDGAKVLNFTGQLHLFIIGALQKLILSMVTGSVDNRPSSIDVLETLEALIEAIELGRQEPEFYKTKGQIEKAFVYAARRADLKRNPVYVNLKTNFLSDFSAKGIVSLLV